LFRAFSTWQPETEGIVAVGFGCGDAATEHTT
jgi:hypothetical protein